MAQAKAAQTKTAAAPTQPAPARGSRKARSLALPILAVIASGLLLLLGSTLTAPIRPDPFSPEPDLVSYLFYAEPDPALAQIPVLPAGPAGTLVFRPQETAWLSRLFPDLTWSIDERLSREANLPLLADADRLRELGFHGYAECRNDGLHCWVTVPRVATDESGEDGAIIDRLLRSEDGGATWSVAADLQGWYDSAAPIRDDILAFHIEEDAGRGWLATRNAEVWGFALAGDDWRAEWLPGLAAQFDEGRTSILYLTLPRWETRGSGGELRGLVKIGLPADSRAGFEFHLPVDGANWLFIAADGKPVARTSMEGTEEALGRSDGQFYGFWADSSALEPQGTTWLVGHLGTLVRIDWSNDEKGYFEAHSMETGTTATLRSLFFLADGQTGWASSGWNDGNEEGERPVILETRDGGQTWSRLSYRAGTPPWVTFGALPAFAIACGLLALGAWRRHQEKAAEAPLPGIAEAADTDRPIGWADHDALGLKPIARAISRLLRNMATTPPLTLAVTGAWGSGKSSLMNLTAEDLRRHRTRPVWFNAWHHQQEESLLAALLEAIRRQAFPSAWRVDGLKFRLALLARRLAGSARAVLALLLVVAAAFALLLLFTAFGWDELRRFWAWLTVPEAVGTAEGLESLLLLGGLPLSLYVLLRAVQQLKVVTLDPAKLLANLAGKASVASFADKLSFRHRYAEEFALVCHTLRQGPGAGVVIFIDDLDRCQPANVMVVLEAVNFLASAGECFIILGIDLERVIHAIATAQKDSLNDLPSGGDPREAATLAKDAPALRRHAERYLEKLINVVVPVPRATVEATRAILLGRAADEPETAPDPAEARRRRLALRLRQLRLILLDRLPVPLFAVVALFLVVGVLYQHLALEQVSGPAPPTAVVQDVGEAAPPDAGTTPPASAEETEIALPALPTDLPARLPGEEESVPPIVWFFGFLLAAGLLLLIGHRTARLDDEESDDSADFAAALRAFDGVIFEVGETPRGVKRQQNHLRFLALLDRPKEPPPDGLDRLAARLTGTSAPTPAPDRGQRLADSEVVVLGATAALLRDAGLPEDRLAEALRACFAGGREDLEERLAAHRLEQAKLNALGRALGDLGARPANWAIERFLLLSQLVKGASEHLRRQDNSRQAAS